MKDCIPMPKAKVTVREGDPYNLSLVYIKYYTAYIDMASFGKLMLAWHWLELNDLFYSGCLPMFQT